MKDDGLTLEDRYRRVLRLLPGYYRVRWEEEMAVAYLDSRVTGDEDEDEYIYEFGKPPRWTVPGPWWLALISSG